MLQLAETGYMYKQVVHTLSPYTDLLPVPVVANQLKTWVEQVVTREGRESGGGEGPRRGGREEGLPRPFS